MPFHQACWLSTLSDFFHIWMFVSIVFPQHNNTNFIVRCVAMPVLKLLLQAKKGWWNGQNRLQNFVGIRKFRLYYMFKFAKKKRKVFLNGTLAAELKFGLVFSFTCLREDMLQYLLKNCLNKVPICGSWFSQLWQFRRKLENRYAL